MSALNRNYTGIHLQANEGEVDFSNQAELRMTLAPGELFGVDPLSGDLPLAPVGSVLHSVPSEYEGLNVRAEGKFKKQLFQSTFLNVPFKMDGNVATFWFVPGSLDGLCQFSVYVEALFPALFSGLCHAPVSVVSIEGEIHGVRFFAKNIIGVSRSIFCSPDPIPFKEHFDKISTETWPAIWLVSAFQYLQQSDRLRYARTQTAAYLSERILALAKSLEAVFPTKVEKMRDGLRELRVKSDYIDVLSSIRYLRNQVDVGHVSFVRMDSDSLQDVIHCADLASDVIRALLSMLLTNVDEQRRLTAGRENLNQTKIPDAVTYVKRYRNIQFPKGRGILTS